MKFSKQLRNHNSSPTVRQLKEVSLTKLYTTIGIAIAASVQNVLSQFLYQEKIKAERVKFR